MAKVLDVLVGLAVCTGPILLAVFVLGWRDAVRYRRKRQRGEQRPIVERIAKIRDEASFMIEQPQAILAQKAVEFPDRVRWIAPILDYYRRLETLATSADASEEEATLLAEEVSQFIRNHRIKGIFIAEQAR